jgi:hypothetical protein
VSSEAHPLEVMFRGPGRWCAASGQQPVKFSRPASTARRVEVGTRAWREPKFSSEVELSAAAVRAIFTNGFAMGEPALPVIIRPLKRSSLAAIAASARSAAIQ